MHLLPTILALGAATPHLLAARTPAPPTIDGHLDEGAWKSAAVSDAFTQKRPAQGDPPTDYTTVRVLYDDDALYIGVECAQRSAPVVARLTRRDRQVESDWVSIGLDTKGEGKTAFEFSVNAAGVLSDGLYSNDTDFSRDWDEIWDAQTAVTPSGWTAEIRVPLHALRYDPRPVQSFGLQVRRYVSARQELDEWSYWPTEKSGEVSLYGHLDNLVGLRTKSHVELLPYVAGKIRYADPIDTPDSGFALGGSLGIDARWHVTPQLTLNATINPDFGQVEADPAVLNLGTIEYFYPEKRPFFLEGADTFATPLNLLYTRRIGRTPDEPEILEEAPHREELAEEPDPVTIYGASKLVGELGGRVSVGQLVAVTGRERVDVTRADGKTLSRLADPLTTYKVLRLKRDFGERAQIGVIGLTTNRYEPSGQYPIRIPETGPRLQLCPGGEEVGVGARCFHDSYVGGVDARWKSPSGDYAVGGQLVGSLIQNGPPRTFRDGTVVKSGDIDAAGQVRLAKEGGNFRGELLYTGHGRKVDYNDLGFMRRQNLHEAQLVLRYQTSKPWWKTLETGTNLVLRDKETLDFVNIERIVALNTGWKLWNSWEIWSEVSAGLPHYDDRELSDGAILARTERIGGALYVGSDPRARVRGEFFTYFDFSKSSGSEVYGEFIATLKALPQLDISLMPTFYYTRGEPRFYDTSDTSYLFGDLLAQTFSLTLRATYTFTPRLTLEAYAQAFLASEEYSDYTSHPIAAPGQRPRIEEGDLRPAPVPSEDLNPSYESGTFNANLVMRWEYHPGSTLYVVYTHGQSDETTPTIADGAGLNFGLLKPRPSSDVLLVKLSYWWG